MTQLTDAEIARIRELLTQGLATAEIADAMGCARLVVKWISCLLGDYPRGEKKDTRNANPA